MSSALRPATDRSGWRSSCSLSSPRCWCSRLDRGTFSLLPTGNGFNVVLDERYASIDCGWKNWEYDKDPQVYFLFSAVVYAERIEGRPDCRSEGLGGKAETVSLGRFEACRQYDGFKTALTVVDDNATVGCDVKSQDESLLPALEKVTRAACEDFIDRLARSRPITYGGNTFLTVR